MALRSQVATLRKRCRRINLVSNGRVRLCCKKKACDKTFSHIAVNNQCPSTYYARVVSSIKQLLDNAIENSQFEDTLRDMYTTRAYIAFTLDKFINGMVKQVCLSLAKCVENMHLLQLQQMVNDDTCLKLLRLHNDIVGEITAHMLPSEVNALYERYQQQAEQLAADQNCFKIYFVSFLLRGII